ncbi:MAG: DNA glycosylase AlkZ-like family protein [Vicinamibacterales bacterium]
MTRTPTSIEDLRRMAVTRSLGRPTTMARAIDMLGFVQADPIRAPARAQDLTLRPRVRGYRAGDLERCYSTLAVEEDVFINYGFVTRSLQALMHPRMVPSVWPTARNRRAQAVLGFVRERGAVHPRDVDAYFSHGTVTNYWGGSSSATTHLLDALHYKGLLRVIRREAGIRIYAPHQHGSGPATPADRRSRLDALVDVVVGIYAPLPAASLSFVVRRLRYAVPHWRGELPSALDRAHRRLSRARVDGVVWYWPGDEDVSLDPAADDVRLLTPFDPIVWDRRRFEMLWGWAYRFEAYTPVSKRKLGYYALPLLWRDRVVGWSNVSSRGRELDVALGYVQSHPPRDRGFSAALDHELERMRAFLSPRPR